MATVSELGQSGYYNNPNSDAEARRVGMPKASEMYKPTHDM